MDEYTKNMVKFLMNYFLNIARRYPALGIFICALILFTVGLSRQEIIGFESRFYLFAQEMLAHGANWFPSTYGLPYPDYPATTTWFIYLTAKLIGQLNKLTAVLPSAIAAAATLSMTYKIAALYDKRWGWAAIAMLLMTNTFVMQARSISPDQYITMVTVICFYLIYSASLNQQVKQLFWIPLWLAFGFACRGPIGLIIPAGVVCSFYLVDKNYKAFFAMGFLAGIVLLSSCAILLYLAYHVGGMTFLHDVIRMQVVGRLQDASLPWYFYWIESFGAYALAYPIAIIVIASIFFRYQTKQDPKLILKLIAWAGIVILGLSLPAGKKIRYILASAPALALLASYAFFMAKPPRFIYFFRQGLFWFSYFLPLIFIVLILAVIQYLVSKHVYLNISYSLVIVALISLWWGIYFSKKNQSVVLMLSALSFMLVFITVIEPINIAANRTLDFVQRIESWRQAKQADLVFYKESPDGLPIKYLVNMQQWQQPFFLNNVSDLLSYQKPAFFITDSEEYNKLPSVLSSQFTLLSYGRIGHDTVAVFERRAQ
jgi:4-amino-4-deoxy-L-arabinose transferase-like glycosyltransferase